MTFANQITLLEIFGISLTQQENTFPHQDDFPSIISYYLNLAKPHDDESLNQWPIYIQQSLLLADQVFCRHSKVYLTTDL